MLLFMDGQAHYATSEIGWKYTAVNDHACSWSVVPEGRYGNAIKRVSTSNDNTDIGYLTIAPFATRAGLWTHTNSGVCGFAFKVNDLQRVGGFPTKSDPIDLFAVCEGAHQFHVKVALNSDGTFTLRGNQETIIGEEVILAQSVEGIQSNSWAYLEFKWLIDETAGTFEMRVNGIPLLNFTGNTDTQGEVWTPLSTHIWTSIHLLGVPSTIAPFLICWLDDLYLADLTGSGDDVRDFLGDGTIITIRPNGVGASDDWTPTPAGANWDQTNDLTQDGDATYVETTAPGARDVYHFEDIPVGATVLGAHWNAVLRKTAEGGAIVRPIVHQGGVDYDGPEQGVGAIVYDKYVTQPYDINPATGARWTAAEINAGQFGIVKTT
jgi:hypothetical protein